MVSVKKYTSGDKMRDLLRDNSNLITVLGRFGIPLGFGNDTVREACTLHNVDERTFLEVVNFVSKRDFDSANISPVSLMGYLKEAHEYFLNFKLPNIRRKLIEAIDCSGENEIAVLILKFYDDYVTEVRKHMEYENNVVFVYVENLQNGVLNRDYTISTFAGKHAPISYKLKELKDVIIQYYPEKNNYLLNDVLLDIIECEQDLNSHCNIEDRLFVPSVVLCEAKVKRQKDTVFIDNDTATTDERQKTDVLSDREKDVLIGITEGLSNKEIADKLCLSVHTVTTHRRNISAKLQIHTTAGLIIYAIANKLVTLKK
ncbi:MAG: LuxR C-terminal-related transcriptional regulator [Muribaculaceae bacterium]